MLCIPYISLKNVNNSLLLVHRKRYLKIPKYIDYKEKYSCAVIYTNKPEIFHNSFVDYSHQTFCDIAEF
jgi:hypothetical protein